VVYVAPTKKKKNALTIFIGNPVGFESVHWIHLALDRSNAGLL
jgi:hypothetical protein